LSVGDLNGIFNASDVGVWPVLPAVTIQQSMGTGLPVVLPRNEWVGHLLRCESGRYFSPDDDDQIVARIAAALDAAIRGLGKISRAARAADNEWLGAHRVAELLLSDAGITTLERG